MTADPTLPPERARISALLVEAHKESLPAERRLAAMLACVASYCGVWSYENLGEFCSLGLELLAELRALVPEGRDRVRTWDDGIEAAADWADELRVGNYGHPYECEMEPALFELQCGFEALTPATICRGDVDLAVRALEGFGAAHELRVLAGAAFSKGGAC